VVRHARNSVGMLIERSDQAILVRANS